MKTKLIATFILLGSFVTSYGQTTKEQIKEAQLKEKSIEKKDKALTNAISDKATKLARKESKRLAKEGWKVSAGALPLEKQLDETWKKQYERDENDYPKYIIANTKTIGTNYSAAKNQALNLAKVELAGLISTHVAGLVENTVANQDLSNQEAASIVKTIDASKSIIAQEMGRTVVLLEVYRVLPNKNTEVQIRIAYNVEIAMDLAKKTIVKKLEEEGAGLQSKLDGLLGMDKLKGIKNNSNVSEE
jgi:hypothetical protein